MVHGEARLLTSCLSAIIDNAVKYSPVDSKIEIISKAEGQFVNIIVNDNGPGFSEKIKNRAFDLLIADNLSYNTQGLGIGLATAKKITDLMNGDISLHNREEHQGASVILKLPKA